MNVSHTTINTSVGQNKAATAILEQEIHKIQQIDSMLINDIEEIQYGHNLMFIPIVIIYAVGLIVAILMDKINTENAGAFVLGLCFIILIIVPLQLRVRNNLKKFNESKIRFEQAGMCLYRSKERNQISYVSVSCWSLQIHTNYHL